MEAELNDNCPAYLYPAIGLRGYHTGTVSVCIMDPDNWNSPDDHDHNNKHTQVHTHTLSLSLTGVRWLIRGFGTLPQSATRIH